MDENTFILEDRIAKIKSINEQYDLENNSYIAFSGGKDSCVLSKLIDIAIPNNHIPRVFSNTGIDYLMIINHVKKLAKNDNRIVILNQTRNIKQTLIKKGYPFKSKVFSFNVDMFNRLGKCKTIRAFLGEETTKNGNIKKGQFACPNELKYIFNKNGLQFKVSHLCCKLLKKDLAKKWQEINNKKMVITGVRKSEGGSRITLSCITNNGEKFNPLIVVNDNWENWFIEKYNVELCKLYYPPYNFKRTGCKGCPFDLHLQQDLETMFKLLPSEYKQCLYLWKPVYDEYIKIGYRLKYYPHEVLTND